MCDSAIHIFLWLCVLALSVKQQFANTLWLTFLGWFNTVLWDQKWADSCRDSCPLFSLHEISWKSGQQHVPCQVIRDSDLYRICPPRAVPAGQQHAWVCQKEKAHQTGAVVRPLRWGEITFWQRPACQDLNVSFCVQFEKQPLLTPSSESRTPFSRKHWRSRSLGGMIKVCVSFFPLKNVLICRIIQLPVHVNNTCFMMKDNVFSVFLRS